VALIVVFCGQVAEAVGKALPVERTAVAALGEAGNVVWRGVAVRIVASLGLSLKAACEEGDEDGRQLERDCEGG
jgi:tetrahydromethanopterin S-methyltransferase subunit C